MTAVAARRAPGEGLAVRLRRDSLVRNSLAVVVSRGLTAALGCAYWVLAARSLPPAEVGVAATLVASMTVASLLVGQGWSPTLVARLAPARRDAAAWSSTFTAVAAGWVATSVPAGIAAWFAVAWLAPAVSARSSVVLAALFVVGVAATTACAVVDTAFTSCRSSGRMAVRAGLASAVKLPVLAAALPIARDWDGGGSLALVASWVLAITASAALGTVVLLPAVRPGFRLRLHRPVPVLRSLKRAFVLNHGSSLGGVLPSYLLPVLVAARTSGADAAYFHLAWTTGSLFLLVSPAVASALLAEGAHAPAARRAALGRAARVTAVLVVPATALMLAAGRPILGLFGAGYARHGHLLLTLLVLSALPDAVTNLAVTVLRLDGRLRAAASLNLSMAATTLALSWVLLPVVGVTAPGVAWLAAQVAGTVVVAVRARRAPLRSEERCASCT